MKGYLNNLAQRLLNTGNRVEPRLPSLFEPNPERNAPYDEEVVTTWMTPSEIAPSQIQRKQATTARESSTHSATRSSADTKIEHAVTSASEHFNIDAEPTVESPSLRRSDSVPSEHSAERQLENSEIIEAPISSPQQEPQITRIQEPQITRVQKPQITRIKADHIGDHSVDPPSSVSSVAQIDSPQMRRLIASETEAMRIEPESHDDDAEVQARINTEREPQQQLETFNVARHLLTNPTSTAWRDTPQYSRRQRRQSVGPLDPETSINVTIGRVEVRAVTDNRKTTAPRRSESPVMPLEEYLRKQRRGGER